MPISGVVVVVGYVRCRYSDVAISLARLHRILHFGGVGCTLTAPGYHTLTTRVQFPFSPAS